MVPIDGGRHHLVVEENSQLRALLDAISRPPEFCAGQFVLSWEKGDREFRTATLLQANLVEKFIKKQIENDSGFLELLGEAEEKELQSLVLVLAALIGGLQNKAKDFISNGELESASSMLFRRDLVALVWAFSSAILGQLNSEILGVKFFDSAGDILATIEQVFVMLDDETMVGG